MKETKNTPVCDIKITGSVNVYSEWLDDEPNFFSVTLSPEFIEWLRKMSRIIKRNKLAYLTNYDYTPELFKKDEDSGEVSEYESGTESEMVVVTDTDFYWKGIIKHTDVRYETETISFKTLNDYIQFLKRPVEDMPMYINNDDENISRCAQERMEGGS